MLCLIKKQMNWSTPKYERSGERQGYRSGHYQRNLVTTSGEVKLNVPKLKGIPFKLLLLNVIIGESALLKKR